MSFKITETSFLFECPHCGLSIEVLKTQVNCRIFRCGQYRKNGHPIPPHSKRELCDKLVREEKIYGCGKPFRLLEDRVEICDYL